MFQIAEVNGRESFFPCVHVAHEGGTGVADAAVPALLPAGAQLGGNSIDTHFVPKSVQEPPLIMCGILIHV